MKLDKRLLKKVQTFQHNEITEYYIYKRLARQSKNSENRKVFNQIAEDEYKHYEFWRHYTEKDIKPNRWKIFKYYWISRIFGITFGVKLMERGEEAAQASYQDVLEVIPEAQTVLNDEDTHEDQLIELLHEDKLNYVGSIVLGLNDALVELTGALAGLTLALQNTRLIAVAGLITGIAASFSMAASEYLSKKSGEDSSNALTSAIYTGFAYIGTVFILIMPYLLIDNYFICLAMTLILAILIILFFNYYIAVAKDLNFKKRFIEMASLSLGVAAFTFGISYFVRMFFGVEV